ncbi:protein kinase [Nocardia sp. NBC_01730]|uniref:serine/threonine-protein kinase n=1 Tax=Nocardia sp. NBC_01730 TaxID=2975998 RepID=UPI002E0E9EAC|nr:protein kinase [Nocardia sp. NBC_01730]
MQEAGPRTGTRFGSYELRSLLGKGGMSEVYEAYDTVKDRVVAVKLLSEELASDPMYQVRFRRESQAAARLAEPHVIPIHDWGVVDGVLFIDMRLVHGVDLRTILRGQGPLSPARAVGIIEQIASALDAAHAGNLVHRDVKPANILVTDSDFAYLADFGIAHTEGDSAVTLVGMAIGSYIYMAPERFDAGPVTGRADIYSLACVLHECLTGATPFPAASMNVLIKSHLSDPPPRPSAQGSGIPAALDAVINRGMAKDPADRFPTATALARAARAALGAAAPAAPTLVVRAPASAQRPGDPTVRGAVPPESTGELSLSAVIHPSAPTVVRPTETQFTPLPSPDGPPSTPLRAPAPYTPAVGLPPMRPFPDAHLYPETQAYAESAGHAPLRAYSGPPTQGYPEVAPRAYSEASSQVYSETSPEAYSESGSRGYSESPSEAYSESGSRADSEISPEAYSELGSQAYSERSVREYSETPPQAYSQTSTYPAFSETPPHPGVENYPETRQYADRVLVPSSPGPQGPAAQDYSPPTEYLTPATHPVRDGHAARTDFPPQGDYPVRSDYPPHRDDPGHGYDEDDEDPYYPSRRGRSVALPIMVAVLAIAVLAIGGAIGWQVFGSGGSAATSADRESEAPVAPTASTGGRSPVGSSTAPSVTSTSARPTPVTLPAGASPCGQGQPVPGAFTQSATGTAVTSCAFAEEVRRAYAELGPAQSAARDASRAVVATSPVTGQSYTMNCQARGQIVTCSGGENAVVYVY